MARDEIDRKCKELFKEEIEACNNGNYALALEKSKKQTALCNAYKKSNRLNGQGGNYE